MSQGQAGASTRITGFLPCPDRSCRWRAIGSADRRVMADHGQLAWPMPTQSWGL